MHKLAIPPYLVPGQKVRVVATSGAVREWERLEKGVQIWRDRGYEVYLPEDLGVSWGYLAGSDRHRRQQLIEAWNDPDCAAILCARGGYGSARLLEGLDWQTLDSHPKWPIGFSDITALLWGIAAHKKIAGLHGPVLTTLATEPDWSIQQLFSVLEGKLTKVTLSGRGLGGCKNTAEGILLPGNLNVATHLIGTPLCPDLDGVILAFEDVAEPPYKVDRMLTHWRWSGNLHKVKGIALGRFSQAEPPKDRPSFSMAEVWSDRLADLGIAIVAELPFGHDGANAPLIAGAIAQLDPESGTLTYDLSQ
ncbi:S66 peptidase family protein [Pseudanabaena sp. PCC 6802]|uniref:S66 peptidase family protein n=1 Tax=Pseudanabaena sp. PCC 6802 TaxID=118173 RepID=UPI00034D2B31|nr:LD-carboxypeptidase [Pseudanabaena sp. PCC 6802]